jgi:6-phosphogluconolactonase
MSLPAIIKSANAEAQAVQVAEWLTARAEATTGRFSIALSGGSTPQRLYEKLATPEFAHRFPWSRTHFFWGDERFVSHADKDSNFRMVREALLDHVQIPPANVHAMPDSGTVEQAAAGYAQDLKTYYGSDTLDMGRPIFDVSLMGLGPDGHTASLFPGAPALEESLSWVVPVHDPSVPQPRITLTYPVFAASAALAFLVEGGKKKAILRRVLAGERALPAARVTCIGELIWFVDEAAIA